VNSAGPQHRPRRAMRGQPLLFLGTVVLLWCAARVIHHLPENPAQRAAPSALEFANSWQPAAVQQTHAQPVLAGALAMIGLPGPAPRTMAGLGALGPPQLRGRDAAASLDFDVAMAHHLAWVESLTASTGPSGRLRSPLIDAPLLIEPERAAQPPAGTGASAVGLSREKRWSVYGWSLLRQGGSDRTLAPGAQYGGSQAGLIVRYAPGQGPLAPVLYARAATALESGDDRSLALGMMTRPWGAVPVDLALERRFGLGQGQRDRFAAMLVAGGGAALERSSIWLDSFAQAGVVGLQDRQGFFDLQLLATRQVAVQDRHSLSLGGGLWAGGQQELDASGDKRWVHRVDLGPRASLALPVGDSQMTFALDWRQRIDGNAQPTSGAALTLSTGF